MSVTTNGTILTTSPRLDLRSFSDEIDTILADRQDWNTVASINSLIDRFIPDLVSSFKQQNELCYHEFGSRAAGGELARLNSLRDEAEKLYDDILSVAKKLEKSALEGVSRGFPVRGLPPLQSVIEEIEAMKAEFFRGWPMFEANCEGRARDAVARGETLSLEEVFGGLPG
jgi:hypothetical protein